MDMDTSLRDRLERTLMPNKVERGGQKSSTSFDIRGLFKQSLNAFKLVQHFNMFQNG